jgi:hypothetical protein
LVGLKPPLLLLHTPISRPQCQTLPLYHVSKDRLGAWDCPRAKWPHAAPPNWSPAIPVSKLILGKG